MQPKKRLLVMDDEEIILESLSLLLSEVGFEVDTVRNGEQAIAQYRESISQGERYEAVIMDLNIPEGLGGRETIGPLRQIDPQVRAVAASGFGQDDVVRECATLGFSDVLIKPFTADELFSLFEGVAGTPA